MPYIVVSPLSQIVEAAVSHGAREMVSLLGENHAFHRPGVIDPRRHLFLDMNDIAVEMQGLVVPQDRHVGRLIAFVRAWDRRAPLVVHCWMGISRSPAAALIAALAIDPEQDDEKLCLRLREASPFSTPNARLIEIADRVLERDGRLVRAVRAIGRGADAYEGRPFCLTVSPRDPAPRTQFDLPADG